MPAVAPLFYSYKHFFSSHCFLFAKRIIMAQFQSCEAQNITLYKEEMIGLGYQLQQWLLYIILSGNRLLVINNFVCRI